MTGNGGNCTKIAGNCENLEEKNYHINPPPVNSHCPPQQKETAKLHVAQKYVGYIFPTNCSKKMQLTSGWKSFWGSGAQNQCVTAEEEPST